MNVTIGFLFSELMITVYDHGVECIRGIGCGRRMKTREWYGWSFTNACIHQRCIVVLDDDKVQNICCYRSQEQHWAILSSIKSNITTSHFAEVQPNANCLSLQRSSS